MRLTSPAVFRAFSACWYVKYAFALWAATVKRLGRYPVCPLTAEQFAGAFAVLL